MASSDGEWLIPYTLGGATDLLLCLTTRSRFYSGRFNGSRSGDGVSGRPVIRSYCALGSRLIRLLRFFGSLIV